MMTSDLSSMLKVREEALNYKIKKEKKKIQKLLSNHKISPRTSNFREIELERWVDKEREDIDKAKQFFEESKRKTEEIIKETMGVEGIFSNYEVTQEALKRLFAEKVTTPREGLSFRSGFNSSRRIYELSQINKQINGHESDRGTDEKHRRHHSSASHHEEDKDNIVFSEQEECKDKLSLKQKIEMKLKGDQEITFEKEKHNLFMHPDSNLEQRKY